MTSPSRPEQDEAVRLAKSVLNDPNCWNTQGYALAEAVLAAPHVERFVRQDGVGIEVGWQHHPASPVPAALDVEQAFVKGWFAALLYAIDEGGDPTSSEEARRQAAEYARLSHQSEDATPPPVPAALDVDALRLEQAIFRTSEALRRDGLRDTSMTREMFAKLAAAEYARLSHQSEDASPPPVPAALDERCQHDDAGQPCGRLLNSRGECSIHSEDWPLSREYTGLSHQSEDA